MGFPIATRNMRGIGTLANALEIAQASNFAIAEAMAEEMGGSTCVDLDLVREIERRLDAGEGSDAICAALVGSLIGE